MHRNCMLKLPGLGKSAKFSLYLTLFMGIALIPFMVSAPHMKVNPLSFQTPLQSPASSMSFSSHADVEMTAEVIMVDPQARLISMNWYPRFTALHCSDPTVRVIDIYISNMLLDISSPSISNIPGQDFSAFRLNSTEICLGTSFASFKTVTKLLVTKLDVYQEIWEHSSLQSYPFDIYLAPFVFYSRILGSNNTKGLEISDSFGVAVNFEVSLSQAVVDGDGLGVRETLNFNLLIKRSKATQIFVVMVAITNWLIAIAFLIICAAAMIFTDSEIYNEMFVVPVGATFAFTSIRANLPGAPSGFGTTMDIFTTLPVLVIMSFCSFSLLLMTLYRRIIRRMDRSPRNLIFLDNHRETFAIEDSTTLEIGNLEDSFSQSLTCVDERNTESPKT